MGPRIREDTGGRGEGWVAGRGERRGEAYGGLVCGEGGRAPARDAPTGEEREEGEVVFFCGGNEW